MSRLPLLVALALAGCEQPAPAVRGPASLQAVPPSYYSIRPAQPTKRRAHDARRERREPALPGQGARRQPSADAEDDGPGTYFEIPPEAADRIEEIHRQLQQLRRSITRPANPRPAPLYGPEDQ